VSDTGMMVNVPGYVNYQVAATHAFLATGGQMKDLGTLGNDLHSVALGVNAKGQVVGMSGMNASSYDPAYDSSNPYRIGGSNYYANGNSAFLYDGQKMVDLNTLINTKGLYAHIDAAFAINDLGQILAQGQIGTSESAILLTPVDQPIPTQPPVLIPEPGTLAIFGLFLGAAAARGLARKRRGLA
jgi:probable HAF family extracellular repeat protein